jgi:hypothetical protein
MSVLKSRGKYVFHEKLYGSVTRLYEQGEYRKLKHL